MHESTNKYYGEQHARHGDQLHWPGMHGIPFRGAAIPNLKKHELEQMPTVGYCYHGTFDLDDEKQAEHYQWICDRARNGLFTIEYRDRRWNEAGTNMLVYVEWTQLYTQLPPTQLPGSNGNGSPNRFTLRGPD